MSKQNYRVLWYTYKKYTYEGGRTMALIRCPECGKEFSDKAQACPNCGCPTSEAKNQELKQEEIKEDPEFELQLENDYSIKINSDTMTLFYQSGFILESDVRGFVLNWLSEEEELGRNQLKVVFSHPGYKKPMKLSVSNTSERYEKAKYFAENVAEKYFKKDICPGYFEAIHYADQHVDNVLFRKAYENERKIIKEKKQAVQNQPNNQQISSRPVNNSALVQNVQIQSAPKKKKKGHFGTFLWVIIILVVLGSVFGNKDKKKTSDEIIEKDGTIWSNIETPLSQFEYYANGNDLYITKHIGESQKIKIAQEYDGKKVVGIEDATFFSSDAVSVIIPEGVTKMEDTVFNSCDIEYMYLPSTLQNINEKFWGYMHDIKELYYGGTQEQWNEICNIPRGELEASEMYCDVTIEALGTNDAKSTPIIMPEVVEEAKEEEPTPIPVLDQHDEFITDASEFLSTDISEKLYNILLNDIGFTEIYFIGKNESGDSIWDLGCDDIGVTVTASDDVYMIWSGDYTFYDSGVKMTKEQFDSLHVSESDKVAYYLIAKEIVKNSLKSPKSADFPWLMDDIGFGKNGDIVAVQGYVDAMNSFGAQIRSQWTVEFKVIDLDTYSYEVVYVNIDGESYGTYVEMN